MKKIVLLCAGGMSTSLLVEKIKAAATNQNVEYDIAAYSVSRYSEVIEDADLILLGPQIKYQLNKLKNEYPNKVIECMNMQDYGMMNGQAILNQIKESVGD